MGRETAASSLPPKKETSSKGVFKNKMNTPFFFNVSTPRRRYISVRARMVMSAAINAG